MNNKREEFLFHTGSIKSNATRGAFKPRTSKFLFHTGSIKSSRPHQKNRPTQQSFYSILVRLKVQNQKND